MHPADKAVLRLAIGMGLAVLIAYGLALPAPFVCCMMTVLMLCKPGPPLPFVKGVVVALIVGGLLAAGVLMVPILENYAVTGVLLTGVLLYAVYFAGARSGSPLTIILVVAFAAIPVAGVAEQALELGSSAWPWPWGSASEPWSAAWRTPSFRTLRRASAAPAPCRAREHGVGEMDGLAGDAGRDARVRARPDQSCPLPAGHHEDGGARAAGGLDRRRFGRT